MPSASWKPANSAISTQPLALFWSANPPDNRPGFRRLRKMTRFSADKFTSLEPGKRLFVGERGAFPLRDAERCQVLARAAAHQGQGQRQDQDQASDLRTRPLARCQS